MWGVVIIVLLVIIGLFFRTIGWLVKAMFHFFRDVCNDLLPDGIKSHGWAVSLIAAVVAVAMVPIILSVLEAIAHTFL